MGKKLLFIAAAVLAFGGNLFSQDTTSNVFLQPTPKTDREQHYTVKAGLEIPLVVAGAAFTMYNFAGISKKDASNQAYILGLSKKDVNGFDRWGVRAYNEKIDNLSYAPFFVSMPLPIIVLLIDNKMRKDFFKLTFMYAEAMTMTGVLYGSAANFTNRLRPMVYSSETPMEKRLSSEQKKSFFAGHVALVATSTFFIARVISEYHPQSKFKWLYYGLAGASTAATAYMRQAAGEHFLSDILVGTTVGTLSGLLTPAMHKCKLIKNQRLSVWPYGGNGAGLVAIYHL